ncbi:N-acetylglucosamine-6-phosphate deacetylase [Psychromonas sp. psych-6C06]|uniref:N-acetylglucosamine-6-phosphate deacetylase n=1 Tax=Psychromonas sp. psych-6C06 TaxID=2058089 RepID=UPI000C33E4F8|nr:N-acetylglucosamine-6-phosphate deacetylase [Psychromonas sp. psych-6C06]PKF61789.1 N-acetylglucosamine-6-phosphate deacetylase [Psychromonas sp. psych-6C06]
MYALTNCKIFTTQAILTDHAVVIENDLIKRIVSTSELDANIECIDLNGSNLTPGFIDLQLNGCGGVMLNGAETQETLEIMQAANLKSGTTSYLPTFITDADEGIKRVLNVARNYMDKTPNEVLGLHLEGPYLSVEKKGIHRQEFIRKPDSAMIDLICENSDIVGMLTLAPENCPAEVVKQLSESNIVVSLGHTNATYAQAKVAIDNGANCATHLFNAMTPVTGREPGVVGAIYDNDIYAGVIVDGFHVAYENVRISKKIMGEKLFLVTDAVAPAGANIDSFDFVGTTVYYKDGKCFGADGTLGGSAVTMIESIEQTVKFVGVELDEAIRMATLYPAKAISVDHKLGSIEAGKIANLTVFSNDYKVNATVVNGIYKAS